MAAGPEIDIDILGHDTKISPIIELIKLKTPEATKSNPTLPEAKTTPPAPPPTPIPTVQTSNTEQHKEEPKEKSKEEQKEEQKEEPKAQSSIDKGKGKLHEASLEERLKRLAEIDKRIMSHVKNKDEGGPATERITAPGSAYMKKAKIRTKTKDVLIDMIIELEKKFSPDQFDENAEKGDKKCKTTEGRHNQLHGQDKIKLVKYLEDLSGPDGPAYVQPVNRISISSPDVNLATESPHVQLSTEQVYEKAHSVAEGRQPEPEEEEEGPPDEQVNTEGAKPDIGPWDKTDDLCVGILTYVNAQLAGTMEGIAKNNFDNALEHYYEIVQKEPQFTLAVRDIWEDYRPQLKPLFGPFFRLGALHAAISLRMMATNGKGMFRKDGVLTNTIGRALMLQDGKNQVPVVPK